MNIKDNVSTIMSSKVIVANQFNTFSQVLRLFSEFTVHHLPIVNGKNHLIGIVSSNDIMRLFLQPKFKNVNLESDSLDNAINMQDIMTPNPVTLSPDDTIEKAIAIFKDMKFHALPVVKDQEIVGILSVKDLVRLFE
jgi:CBS domain-containing protein